MEIYMTENKLKPYILGTVVRPLSPEASELWNQKDAEAQAFLMRGLELDQLKYLSDCTTAAAMWSRLKSIHAERSDQSIQVLLDQFINCKMEAQTKIADHVAHIVSLAQRLKDMNMEQQQPVVIAKILSSLPAKYDNVRTAWYAVRKVDQTIEKLTDHLVNEEALQNLRMGTAKEEGTQEAYFAKTNRGGPGSQKGNAGTKRYNCNYCGKFGHSARDCFKRKAKQQGGHQQGGHQRGAHHQGGNHQGGYHQGQSMVAQANCPPSVASQPATQPPTSYGRADLFTMEAESFVCLQDDDSWFADSGATEHMCFRRDWFVNMEIFANKEFPVRVGNGNFVYAHGRGDVQVSAAGPGGELIVHTIQKALYVPDIKKNLLSIGSTTKKGMTVVFEEGGRHVKFQRDGLLVVDGLKHGNGLYKLNLKPVLSCEANVALDCSLMAWHERMGHVNFKTLKSMVSKSAVLDLKVNASATEEPFCEGCVLGKQHRTPFPKSGARRSDVPGEIFHVDLCGKMSQPAIKGSNYFLLFKDDCSRYCFVYFLKDKPEVLDCVKQFYADVRADGHEIRVLRSDWGTEIVNGPVKEFLLSKGIKHERSTPRAPEQNGFVERQHRTVVESAKSMLHAKKLPLYLWAEATNTAVHVKNRTASDTLNGATPYERWFGTKPSVKHLRIFGSECYVHVTKDQRGKFQENSIRCLMVGYCQDSKAYRVYDPVGRRCLIRRDVVFHETVQSNPTPVLSVNNQGSQPDAGDAVASGSAERPVRRNPRLPTRTEPYELRSRQGQKQDAGMLEDEEGKTYLAEAFLASLEPATSEEALEAADSNYWIDAINDEIGSLEENGTWILVPRPDDAKVIPNRWVFKKKYKADGSTDKFKARLVVKGYAQTYGVDYTETFAPVVKYDSVRLILSVAAAHDMNITQFDVKTAFLNGDLDEVIYMEQPYGFEQDDRVCLLKKSLYGLKQAPRQWNIKIAGFLERHGLTQSKADPCVYYYITNQVILFLALYVDDGLLCSNNCDKMNDLLKALCVDFKIRYNEAEYFVGIQIERDRKRGTLKLHEAAYAQKVLSRFNHSDCSPVSVPADPGIKFSKNCEDDEDSGLFPYREAIGSMMYLMVATRPDLAFIVSVLSQFTEKPSRDHWNGVKRVLRYIKGTMNFGIVYRLGSLDTELTGFCDSDWAGDIDTRRSTTGWIYLMNRGPVAWSSRKQTATATSATEVEFVALCSATKEAVWLQRLLCEIICREKITIPIYCDNLGAISLVKTPECYKRSKHIDTQYHYTCDKQADHSISVRYIKTDCQLADPLTKALAKGKFQRFRSESGILN